MEADEHRIRLCADKVVCKRASGLPGRTFAVTNSTAGIAAGPDPFTSCSPFSSSSSAGHHAHITQGSK